MCEREGGRERERERERERDSVLRSVSKTGAAVVQLMRPAVESSVCEHIARVCVCLGEKRSRDSKCVCFQVSEVSYPLCSLA